tara:strand:- start:37 stop:294 length:258 start_codon:yes stop_codon:yes gene_type:complete
MVGRPEHRTITDSRNPRPVWIIANLMRFVPWTEVNAELTNAAFKLSDEEYVSGKHWRTITDHLITVTGIGFRSSVRTTQWHGIKF